MNSVYDLTIISEQFTNLLVPFGTVLIMIVFTLWFRDSATKVAKGIAFKMSTNFREGDKVILDDEQALIVKIGLLQTVFGITKPCGNYCWRYVPNERISFLKIEKIIFDNTAKENKKKIDENGKKIENLGKNTNGKRV